MSSASNLGYGNQNPYNTSPFVNGTSTNNPLHFSSNEIPGCPGVAGAKSNVDAAAGIVPSMKGGSKSRRIKRKIKNITKYYKKMKAGSRKIKSLKRKLRNKHVSKRTRRYRRKQRGGGQYQNNDPISASYKIAGINLPASQLALANPAPFTSTGGTGYDNYNHYNNTTFPSRGH